MYPHSWEKWKNWRRVLNPSGVESAKHLPRGSSLLTNRPTRPIGLSFGWWLLPLQVGDIVRGMLYLHDSPVRSHGRLHSANCLIDSRSVTSRLVFNRSFRLQPLHLFGVDAWDALFLQQPQRSRATWRPKNSEDQKCQTSRINKYVIVQISVCKPIPRNICFQY